MKHPVKEIRVLNKQDFENSVEESGFDKFLCSADKYPEAEETLRMEICSKKDLFDEMSEQLNSSGSGFRMFGSRKNKTYYLLIEVYLQKGF